MTSAVHRPISRVPTLWGCSPRQLHDRMWAACGVQVVRPREPTEVVPKAGLFLLLGPDTLVLFRPAQVTETLYWLGAKLLILRLRDARERAYREVAVTDRDQLVGFQRVYRDRRGRSVRVALTDDPAVARAWHDGPAESDERAPWKHLRTRVSSEMRAVRSAVARVYDACDDAQAMECVRDMMLRWSRPESTVPRARPVRPDVSADLAARVDPEAVLMGPVWVGAGRRVQAGTHVIGPAVLWDDPDARPAVDDVPWVDLEPAPFSVAVPRNVKPRAVPGKRLFDVAFALVALALTLPLYPIVAFLIWIEDGRPIFFAHRRESVGGREFGCLKFRSMRKRADIAKAELRQRNQADGPQFFIENDPRVTRVGRVLRKLQVDELPQFWNVLLGHMSIVGPRPSPYEENQYCPAWREARLSVRPGITGLWQVSRTRRKGRDFQEWIRFDLAYVENASWGMDLRILAKTVGVVLQGVFR